MVDAPLRVLLVEDNPGDARLVAIALEGQGQESAAKVDHVGRLSDAIAYVKRARPDVILLDLSLPDDFGGAAVMHLRKAAPTTPILAFTGTSDPAVLRQALEAGARGAIVKHHFERGELEGALRDALQPSSLPSLSLASRWLRRGRKGPASPRDTPAIDPAALDDLRSLAPAGEGENLVRTVSEAFLHQGGELVKRLQADIDRSDPEDARSAAHSFRSSTVHVGAWELTELSEKIERFASGGKLDPVRELLEDVRRAMAEARAELERVCPELRAGGE